MKLCLALLALVLLPSTANAATFSPDRQLDDMAAVGAKYWVDRGLTTCETGFSWEWADDFPAGAYGQSEVGSCHGVLARGAFDWLSRDRRTLATRCTIVVHEMGHGHGLEHADYGIMHYRLEDGPPRACRVWAKAAIAAQPRRPLAANMARRVGTID
jgi:hypothetical protein